MKTIYKDRANDNAAIIEAVKMRAYKGAAYKTGYRLTMLDTGANNFECVDYFTNPKVIKRACAAFKKLGETPEKYF